MENNNVTLPFEKLLEARRYDPNKEPEAEHVLMFIEGKPIGAVQNFVTVQGKQKAGKTRYFAAIAASALTNSEIFNIRLRLPEHKRRIVYFDTEQSDYDFYRTITTIKKLSHLDRIPSYFDAFNMREDAPATRLQLVATYLRKFSDCGLVLLDGALDLLNNYNDETESAELITHIKRWTKNANILLVMVIHTGKGSDNSLGHFGAWADRAAQSVLGVEKNKEKGTYILKPMYLRSTDDFTPIEILYNQASHNWEQTFYTPENDEKVKPIKPKPGELDKTDHKLNVARIFDAEPFQSYNQVVEGIKIYYCAPAGWAKDCVTWLLKENLIYRTMNGFTNVQQAKLSIKTK